MRNDRKCGIRRSALLALGIAICGMGQTASAGNFNGAQTTGVSNIAPAPFDPMRVDPALYPHQIVGGAYQVAGKIFHPAHNPQFDQSGKVSWYGAKFQGKLTASGERFDRAGLTAAHPTLPLNSLVNVTNLATGKSLVVRINDRGPFTSNGIIDLSEAAAAALGFGGHQGAVRVQYAGAAMPAGTAPSPAPKKSSGSILPDVSLPTTPQKAPQAYQDQVSNGDESSVVLTIKGPIHIA